MKSPGRQVQNVLLEISEEITPERMNRQSQSKNNTQLWMGLVIEARFWERLRAGGEGDDRG